jgi:hypothetical protein
LKRGTAILVELLWGAVWEVFASVPYATALLLASSLLSDFVVPLRTVGVVCWEKLTGDLNEEMVVDPLGHGANSVASEDVRTRIGNHAIDASG